MENIHGFALYFGEKKMCKDFVNKYDKKETNCPIQFIEHFIKGFIKKSCRNLRG